MGVIGPASLQSVRIDCNLFGRLKWREAVNVPSDELRAFLRISAASLYKLPICKLRDGHYPELHILSLFTKYES